MNDENLISKTRRKRQMHELQSVGATLTRMPGEQLAKLELPERLREAVDACRAMTKHEAVRRQMQYIGKIMRTIDAEPIVAQLAALAAPATRETALFHRAEKWRAALIAEPGALERFVLEFPQADPDALRRLAAAAREEREAERAPKRYRELFQAVNAILRNQEGRPE